MSKGKGPKPGSNSGKNSNFSKFINPQGKPSYNTNNLKNTGGSRVTRGQRGR